MPVTFKKIASVTVTGATAADIEFTSIPSTYTDLVLFVSLRGDRSTDYWQSFKTTFNGSATGYSYRMLYAQDSSTVSSAALSSESSIRYSYANYALSTANTFSSGQIYIPNYTSSNNKSVSLDTVTETNGVNTLMSLNAGLWANSAAITSIKIAPESNNWVQYSTATLYGISKS